MANRKYPRGEGWLPHAPRTLPSLDLMVEDIGASPVHLARHLGVSQRMTYRWSQGVPPYPRRVHQLAVFYETSWGRDYVATSVHNEAVTYGRAMIWLQAEVVRLRELLGKVGQLGEFGSANDPSPDVPLPTGLDIAAAYAAMPTLMRKAA